MNPKQTNTFYKQTIIP